jgi:type III secretion protein HrpB1
MEDIELEFEVRALARAMVQALRQGEIDQAEALLQELYQLHPPAEQLLVFPALIAIQRGQAQEALQFIHQLPEGSAPELQALCLYILGDASWQGCAQALEEHGDPHVRKAMRQLLGRPEEEPVAVMEEAAW